MLGTIAISALVVSIPAWHAARKFEDERHFLKTFRAPFDSEAIFTYGMDYATHSAERNDVVFVGDSTCLSGIETRQFEQISGLTAYNLGTIGMIGIDGYTVLLKSYLEHHPAPRVVVLCVLPSEVGPPLQVRRPEVSRSGPRAQNITERFLWCFGQAGEYPRPTHPNLLQYYVSQGLLMALGDLRGGERHYLNTPTNNLGNLSFFALRDDCIKNRGFFSFNGSSSLPPTSRRDISSGFFLPAEGATVDDPFPVSPAFDDGVRRLARLAADQGALLMIRLTPELTGMNAERFGRIEDWFERLPTECPNVVCDQPAVLLYGPEYFADIFHHLNFCGAEKFTELVAASVMHLSNSTTKAKSKNAASADRARENLEAHGH